MGVDRQGPHSGECVWPSVHYPGSHLPVSYMKRAAAILAMVLIAALGISATVTVHQVVEKPTGAQFIWTDDEAYLFIGWYRLGWRPSYLRWVLIDRTALLPFGSPATNTTPSVLVFKVSRNGVEKQLLDNRQLGNIGIVEGRPSDGHTRWLKTGTNNVSPLQLQQLSADPPAGQFSNVDGWSKRSVLPLANLREVFLPFDLGGKHLRLRVFTVEDGVVAVDLDREAQVPERLWSADQRVRFVSGADYTRLFPR